MPNLGMKHASSRHSLQIECWLSHRNPAMDYGDRMNISFPGREGVSDEINAKYHFLRQMSDFGQFLGELRVISRHILQVECWFLDNNSSMDHMDRMKTSFPGHEGISCEILAKYFILSVFSDLAISAAHRDGFCERMWPSLQVGVYLPHTTLSWDHRRLIRQGESREICCSWPLRGA